MEKKDWYKVEIRELIRKNLGKIHRKVGDSYGIDVSYLHKMISEYTKQLGQEAEKRGYEKAIKKIIAEYGEDYNNGCGCCSTKYLEDELPKLLEEENGKQNAR